MLILTPIPETALPLISAARRFDKQLTQALWLMCLYSNLHDGGSSVDCNDSLQVVPDERMPAIGGHPSGVPELRASGSS